MAKRTIIGEFLGVRTEFEVNEELVGDTWRMTVSWMPPLMAVSIMHGEPVVFVSPAAPKPREVSDRERRELELGGWLK